MRVDNKSFYADLFTKSDTRGRGREPAPAAAPPVPAVPKVPVVIPGAAAKAVKAMGKAVAVRAVKAPGAPVVPVAAVNDETAKPVLKVRSALYELIGDVDTHHLSPRQMSELSLNLYATGAISFDDYSALAFQAELHPDFDRTIGALTGERADPDRPRDFVRLWDDRADFQRRHNAARADLVEQSERIASVLRQIETPMSMVV